MKKVMLVGCGEYMDSGYGCAGDGSDYVDKPSVRGGTFPPLFLNPHAKGLDSRLA
jgi:hypothetical protein